MDRATQVVHGTGSGVPGLGDPVAARYLQAFGPLLSSTSGTAKGPHAWSGHCA